MPNKYDIQKIPRDVFSLSLEEKYLLLEDIRKHGFQVHSDNDETIPCIQFDNRREIENSGLYSEEEIDYIYTAAFQTFLSTRCYLFENGKVKYCPIK